MVRHCGYNGLIYGDAQCPHEQHMAWIQWIDTIYDEDTMGDSLFVMWIGCV